MDTIDKIGEAEFFYKKLEEPTVDFEDIRYYFSAFLNASHSIYDHLLELYNNKYNLGIQINETLNEYNFLKKAIEKDSTDAVAFITWYIKKMQDNNKLKIWKKLGKKRNVNIHRQSHKLHVYLMSFENTLPDAHDKRHVSYQPAAGVEYEEIKPLVSEFKNKEAPNTKIKYFWSIEEFEGYEGLSICREYLNMMKNLVTEAQEVFD